MKSYTPEEEIYVLTAILTILKFLYENQACAVQYADVGDISNSLGMQNL